MNVSLTPDLEDLVNEKVQRGEYTSARDVVREALRLLNDRDIIQQQRLTELRREVAVGLEELEQGHSVPGNRVFKQLRQRSQARRRAAQYAITSELGMKYDGPLMQSIFEDFLRRREQEAPEQKKDAE